MVGLSSGLADVRVGDFAHCEEVAYLEAASATGPVYPGAIVGEEVVRMQCNAEAD
jgi:hypothetical protein